MKRTVHQAEDLLPFVRGTARRLVRSHRLPIGLETADLVQEGVVALLEAQGRYAPESIASASLQTFANFRVRGSMLDLLCHWPLGTSSYPLSEKPAWFNPVVLFNEDTAVYERQLPSALGRLSQQERTIVLGRLKDKTFRHLAHGLGLSKTKAFRLHQKALTQLRLILEHSDHQQRRIA